MRVVPIRNQSSLPVRLGWFRTPHRGETSVQIRYGDSQVYINKIMVVEQRTAWDSIVILDRLKGWLMYREVPEDCTDEMLIWLVNQCKPKGKGMGENPISFLDAEVKVQLLDPTKNTPYSYDAYRITFEMDINRKIKDIYLG